MIYYYLQYEFFITGTMFEDISTIWSSMNPKRKDSKTPWRKKNSNATKSVIALYDPICRKNSFIMVSMLFYYSHTKIKNKYHCLFVKLITDPVAFYGDFPQKKDPLLFPFMCNNVSQFFCAELAIGIVVDWCRLSNQPLKQQRTPFGESIVKFLGIHLWHVIFYFTAR